MMQMMLCVQALVNNSGSSALKGQSAGHLST